MVDCQTTLEAARWYVIVNYPHWKGSGEAVLEIMELLITRCQNKVTPYIMIRPNIEICVKKKRRV